MTLATKQERDGRRMTACPACSHPEHLGLPACAINMDPGFTNRRCGCMGPERRVAQMVRKLNEADYAVVLLELPGGNLKAVMLYHHVAAPHPVRDTFLHLKHHDEWPESASALGLRYDGVNVLRSIRVQAETMLEAVVEAARQAAVDV